MKTILLIMALALPPDRDAAIIYLSGVGSMEELDEETLERYMDYYEHPLDINIAGRSALSASGLFSALQIEALLDYRRQSGDILSFSELALVDGFTRTYTDALRYFVSLRSNAPPGQRQSLRYDHELVGKFSLDHEGSRDYAYKYDAELGDRAELKLKDGRISAAYYGRRYLGKLVLGTYNARFGQGLLNWSGFSMSGYSSVSSFYKRSSGISATSSSLSGHKGVACDLSLGRNMISLGYSMGNGLLCNLNRVSRSYTAGLSISYQGASADFMFPLPDSSVFGELACRWDGSPAALLGSHWSPAYGYRYALLLRGYSPVYKQYSGVALGVEIPGWIIIADWGYRTDKQLSQTKLLSRYSKSIAVDSLLITPSVRAQCRYRPSDTSPLRLELRAEIDLAWQSWLISLRGDIVHCSTLAWLWYLETGRKCEDYGIYLRGGLFKVDDWDDRIYVYERNAPGSFSVPAYYGRGWSASLYAYWHINRHHSVYLRLEKSDYPWNLSHKAGKSELKLQYRHRF